jgi:hypothetical protein
VDEWQVIARIFGVVAFENEMSCMSSRAINIACARAMMARHSVSVMFYYMRLEQQVCVVMSRGRLIHE